LTTLTKKSSIWCTTLDDARVIDRLGDVGVGVEVVRDAPGSSDSAPSTSGTARAMGMWTLTRRFPAKAEEVGPVRREVAAYAREHGIKDPDAVALAVSEALTNAVVHAYVDAPAPGDIEVVARRVQDNGLEVRVCDEGRGMAPRPDSPGLGLGLPLVAALAERFEVQARSDGGTRLLMVFAQAA
jgi:serine/threonine-protein kinase RsbW